MNLHTCELADLINQANTAGHETIRRERAAIDEHINAVPTPFVYGFTTLLGHLDDEPMTPQAQAHLLDAHLVGPTRNLPAEFGRLLITVKLAQLASGGSGIHPDTADALRRALDSHAPDEWVGAFTASYGCGDVVPGAWFVHNLMTIHGLELTHPGDLIALINGHFVSTAIGLIAADAYRRLIDRIHLTLDRTAAIAADATVQPSVTARDRQPLQRSLAAASGAIGESLRNRLITPSANPLFHTVGTDNRTRIAAHSQASFLDYTLTNAFTGALLGVGQIAATVKGSIKTFCDLRPNGSQARIQPVKVAHALISTLPEPVRPSDFTISESAGIEDAADHSLDAALRLIEACTITDDLIDIAEAEAECAQLSGTQTLPCPKCEWLAAGLRLPELAADLANQQ